MPTLLDVFKSELRRIFQLRAAFSVLVLGVIVYAFLYPQPYLNEALRRVPIAIVDQDGTQSSRELSRLIDATSDAAVAMVLPDLPTAQREVFARKIYGIVVVPKYFEREVLHGRPSAIALYADASYFLIYQRVSGAVSTVAKTFGSEIESTRLVEAGVGPQSAQAAADPMPLVPVPLFNPEGGYATYVLPAALVLILQQTLLIGVGILGSTADGQATMLAGRGIKPAFVLIGGKLLAYLLLEFFLIPFYLLLLPRLYGVPRLGSAFSLILIALPFVVAVSCLGLTFAKLFRNPLLLQLFFASVGIPFFFLAGFAWPMEAMPTAVRAFSQFLPSTFAIDGFVRSSQLGASFFEIRSELIGLVALAALYFVTALVLTVRETDRGISSDR